MRIVTPTQIEQVAWEGYLEPLTSEAHQYTLPGELLGKAFRGDAILPRVTLGEPAWWPAEQAVEGETGKKWTSPAGNRRFTLVRLSCTLHPPDDRRTHYTEVTLAAYLRPHQGSGSVIAHDLYPQRLTVESKDTFTVGLGPDLKFGEIVDVSLLEVGAEIEYRQVYPVIQGFGLGESAPYWQFAHHAAHPLLGCQSVYAVADAPLGADGVRLSVELTAALETRYGIIAVGLPEPSRAHLSRVIGG